MCKTKAKAKAKATSTAKAKATESAAGHKADYTRYKNITTQAGRENSWCKTHFAPGSRAAEDKIAPGTKKHAGKKFTSEQKSTPEKVYVNIFLL